MTTKHSSPPAGPSPETQTLITRTTALMSRMMRFVAERFLRGDRDQASEERMNDGQSRLNSLSRRLRDLLARIDAGIVPEYHSRKSTKGEVRERAPRVKPAMGRGYGWLIKEQGPDLHDVNLTRDWIGQLLNEPEMLERLEKAPRQAGRIVRPICHMLMLPAPETFRLPPRPRPARVPKPRVAREVRVRPGWIPRVASANWPKGVVEPGETVPLRKRNRRRTRRQE